ncbi:DEAD/DEAH box helicase [Cyanobium sp. WAJ14-Wanaka]|uniref:DEAD/DEAH box helicase n=1 Tax=Cyanobium sp. WAJ14-Wanaka TaxID=2823725 RepID=UPI0020CEB70B|nr:DEAD/DEAH box helicase family protein [Cyanobium sp. WAJ14-Wanaka]MCP9775072.1 DEAD/DEAH box helicase family protein [Cyanobium sp. WAJ14-Wanaka]
MAPPSFDLAPRPAHDQTPRPANLEPRDWQRQLIQLLRARLLRGAEADVLIHAGPGAGKTLGALLGFQKLHREQRLERFLVFSHRSSIARQWRQAAERLGLRLLEWDPDQGLAAIPQNETWHGLQLSYQAAGRHCQRLLEELPHAGFGRWMAIADEVHHLGLDPDEPEAAAWGHAFSRLTGTAQLRLGLTGTPFRADNLAFCAAKRVKVRDGDQIVERIAPDLSVEPRQLINAGDVRPLEFRFQDGWVEHGRRHEPGDRETSPLSAEERESWRSRNLRRAIQLGDDSSIALRLLLNARSRLELVRQEHPGAGGLAIARDIAHARQLAALLEEQGDRVHLVHSQDPEAAMRLASFQAGEADWLVSIDMCAEGFDAPRLRVVAYLTTVVTRSRFVQAITRAVRMDGQRSALETIPRHPSYVYAPADPLLISYARTWSLSEPYLLRPKLGLDPAPDPGGGLGAAGLPLEAIGEQLGGVLRIGGPQLPQIRRKSA